MKIIAILALAQFVDADAFFDPSRGESLADAVDRIQASPVCSDPDLRRRGCRIVLGRRHYNIDRPIKLCKQIVLEGHGGWGDMPATLIRSSTTAIYVAPPTACDGADGSWSTVRDIGLESTAEPGVLTRRDAGILAEARIYAENMHIRGFTQGIRISAGANRGGGVGSDGWPMQPVTNANRSSLHQIRVVNSQHAGVFIDGPDSNAGYTQLLDVTSNCLRADAMPELGECANIVDSSFLGNTHVALHSSNPRAASGVWQRHIITDSINARNVWLGTYTEGHALDPLLSRNDIALGGLLGGIDGDAMVFGDGTVNRLCSGGFCVGLSADGALYELDVGGDQYRVKAQQFGELWGLRTDVNNLNGYQTGRMLITADGPLHFDLGRTLLPACTSTTGVTWSSPSGLVVRSDAEGMSVCDGSD